MIYDSIILCDLRTEYSWDPCSETFLSGKRVFAASKRRLREDYLTFEKAVGKRQGADLRLYDPRFSCCLRSSSKVSRSRHFEANHPLIIAKAHLSTSVQRAVTLQISHRFTDWEFGQYSQAHVHVLFAYALWISLTINTVLQRLSVQLKLQADRIMIVQ